MTVKMIEWLNNHWYKVNLEDGTTRFIPSVTTKLGITDKPFLAKWRGDIGNREADMRLFEAQQRGSRIHAAFDIFQRGGVVIYNPWQYPTYTEKELDEIKGNNASWVVLQYQDEMYDLIKLQKFFEIVKPKVFMTESTVYDLENNDAGTLDALYEIKEGKYPVNGKTPLFIPEGIYVADLKTGSMIDTNAYRQTAAYSHCLKKMNLFNPTGSLILHTQSKNKGGIEGLGVHLRMDEDFERDYKSYRLISSLWEEEHGNEIPKVFEFPSIIKREKTNATA